MKENYEQYYSENSLLQKIGKVGKLAGVKVIYAVLLLFYVLKDKQVPFKTKIAITAALGYFIFPMDAIPDIAPLIGFSDDLGVLIFALSQISENVTPEIKQKAQGKLVEWFGEINQEDINEINSNLS